MPAKVVAPAPHHADLGFTAALSGALASARRPSPWHEIAPLSTPVRRGSASAGSASGGAAHTPPYTPSPAVPTSIPPPIAYDSDEGSPHSTSIAASASSQAMRDWERLVATPNNDITRHALVPLSSAASSEGSPQLLPSIPMPKLAAERDKEGHIEYKLKLIEPSPERFERLVTQMMWRLKQGRNEAIYELGLADDGTVIGLTRAEMDASLATLERMASEVGATVLVLKEIVLTAPPERRPDLDEHGRPRKGTRGLGEAGEIKSRRERLRAKRAEDGLDGESPPRLGSRAIIFDEHDVDSDDEQIDEDEQFVLDLERPASATSTNSTTRARSSPSPANSPLAAEAAARAEAKRRKSAARREARRLDLLRGDGTGLPFAERSSSPVAEFIGHAPATDTIAHMLPLASNYLAHQPARPSSLRLERKPEPCRKPAAASPGDVVSADDAFLDGLGLPLDSLSLSFADVHSTSASAATSPTKPSVLTQATEASRNGSGHSNGNATATLTTHALAPIDPASLALAPPGQELICVEALVVRKRHGDEWEYGGEEDGWGFGAGEDDGWGLGGDEEWRLEAESDEDGTEREADEEGEGVEEENGWGF